MTAEGGNRRKSHHHHHHHNSNNNDNDNETWATRALTWSILHRALSIECHAHVVDLSPPVDQHAVHDPTEAPAELELPRAHRTELPTKLIPEAPLSNRAVLPHCSPRKEY